MTREVLIAPNFDLTEIATENKELLQKARDSNILITGGTGFVGSWVWQAIHKANDMFGLDIQLFLLSRNPNLFHIKNEPNLHFIEHDLLYPLKKDLPSFDFVFSSLTPSQPDTGGLDIPYVQKITSSGNKNLIEFVVNKSKPVKFFNTSSGAVEQRNIGNDFDPKVLKDVYAASKIELESYLKKFHGSQGLQITNGRLFTFFGPGIPLDAHFAIGNFLRNARDKKAVEISGNPNTIRSYLYPTDMVSQILKSWIGEIDAIDVPIASYIKTTMKDLAEIISIHFGNGKVLYPSNQAIEPTTYFPSSLDFNFTKSQQISLLEGLERWNYWLNQY
jgi:nucleoside-diphosphate-sugar epimerase